MYLKRIELRGFKSFADKTLVEFNKGMTCIVGPNGSGKSNIGDAVRWVLGEQSVKSLRGGKMEDIIFAGTKLRKPLAYAEVSLEIDNQDKKMPIAYTTVEIKRRVYRSGESEYYINQKICRLKDIRELFMDTGIGIEGYSIIGQGKIDEIINSRPLDRRALFDEAAGIVKFKTRKKESMNKLNATYENIARVEDIIEELERQIEPLKRQSEDAKIYLELKKQLKILDVNYILDQMHSIKNETEQFNSSKIELLKDKDDFKAKYVKLDEKVNIFQSKLVECDMDESEISSDYEKSQLEFQENEKRHLTLKERIRFTQIEVNRLKEELEMSLEKKEENDEKLDYLKNQLVAIDKEFSDKEKQLVEKSNKETEIINLISKNENEIKKLENEANEKRKQWSELEMNIGLLNQKKEHLEEQKKQIVNRRDEIYKNSISKQEELEQLNDKNDNYNKIKITAKQEVLKWIEQINKIKEALSNTSIKVQDLNNVNQKNKAKLQTFKDLEQEFRGYQKGVKALLKEWKKNPKLSLDVHGPLINLIDVEKKYALAIDTALGAAMQNIVVENTNTAKKMISYLKQNKLGRGTFLPLDVIKGYKLKELPVNITEDEAFIGYGYQCLSYRPIYEPVLKQLLGKVLICKDLDSADRLARLTPPGFRYVTLEGDVVFPRGAMSGGSKGTNSNLLLTRKKEIEFLENEISIKDKKIEDIKKVYIENSKKLEDTESAREQAQEYLKDAEINQKLIEEKLIQIKNDISKQDIYNKEIEEKLNEIEEKHKDISNEIIKNKEYQKEFTEKDSITNNFQQELLLSNENLKVKLNENQNLKKYIEIDIEKLNERKQYGVEKCSNQKNQIIEIQNQVDNLKIKILENNNYINGFEEEILKIESHREVYKEKSDELKIKIEENKKLRVGYRLELEKLSNNLHQIDKEILKLDNDINSITMKIAKIEMKSENLIEQLWQEYELSIPMAEDIFDKEVSRTNLKGNIQSKRKQIRDLGDVNVKAIEEYLNVSERYKYLKTQRSDLRDAEITLKELIEYLDEQMNIQFISNMKNIRVNFQESFESLFGGGKTNIVLSDPENVLESGIEIEVQPPGKNLQNMMLLSGGEKALTAIALLFGILKLKPTPFCLLDEIEAALDDANVSRFAKYLQIFKETQFIIITHRKGTMELADTLYGVTMEEKGVSKIVSVQLKSYEDS